MTNFYSPVSIEETLQLLAAENGRARIIAGGTDLYLDLSHGKKQAESLVDVRRIPQLREIYEKDGAVFIGAGVTHTELAESKTIREKFAALAKGASVVGGPQIRNIGTIGGNIVNGQPAADTAIRLLALDAQAVVIGLDGSESIRPMDTLYLGPGRSAIDSTRELLKGFLLPDDRYSFSDFDRVAKRNALALPILNTAIALHIDNGVVQACRIAAGPIGPAPTRLVEAEHVLIGQALTSELCQKAGQAAEKEASPRNSLLRGSSHFRKELLGVMISRLLTQHC